MQARGLLVATVALALLAAGVWFSNREEARKAEAPKADAPPKVLSIPLAELREVIVDGGADRADHVRVERREDATYGVLEPAQMAADTEAATALFLQFSALEAERVVAERASNLAQYGLEPARVVITALRKKGPPTKVLLGEMSPTGTSTYAKVEGDARADFGL